jgi:hypothetical protein
MKTRLSLSVLLVIFLSAPSLFTNNKQATLAGVGIIFFVLLIETIFIKSQKNSSTYEKKGLFEMSEKTSRILIFFTYLISVLITQNVHLNFEVISWDIPSYLVASQEINNGFLPFETQWESKGPLFLYFYNFISNLVNNSYVYFRIANDFILLFIAYVLFNISYRKSKDYVLSFAAGIFFILLTSIVWYVSEYSEIYSLLFISIAHLINISAENSKPRNLLVGLCLGLSTLINQGTVLFVIPFGISYIIKKKKIINKIINFSAGFLLPHLLFIFVYYFKGLIDIYISNYIQLPLAYTSASLSSFYELKVWIRGYYEFDKFLFTALILLLLFFCFEVIREYILNKNYKNLITDPEFFGLFVSIALYFIAGHNYYHHLFYFLFFVSLLIFKFKYKDHVQIVYIFIAIAFVVIISKSIDPALSNLRSPEVTQNNYPLYQLSEEINDHLQDYTDSDILALDYLLILYYLERPNFSYVVHPSNHFDPIVLETLINLGKVPTNHISKMIEEEPRVIICNPRQIIYGEPQRVDTYNCAISDYKLNYKKLDTTYYQNNFNLEFYKNPYQFLNVFIKQD